MGLFRHEDHEAAPDIDEHERLPAIVPTECMGEKCRFYGGTACNAYEEWINAGGPKEGRDLSQPPFADEANYIRYGTACMATGEPQLVAQRIEVFKPEEVNVTLLALTSDRYGEMPVSINTPGGNGPIEVRTLASSD